MAKVVEEKAKPDIDLRLATIRRDCLQLANHPDKEADEIIEIATKMYNFITGMVTIEPTKQEWK